MMSNTLKSSDSLDKQWSFEALKKKSCSINNSSFNPSKQELLLDKWDNLMPRKRGKKEHKVV